MDIVEKGERQHDEPGDPPDLGGIALRWYCNFDWGAPHTSRESNMAVEGFKDGYRAALSAIEGETKREAVLSSRVGELERVLERIARHDVGLQGLIEDGKDTPDNVANYYASQVERRRKIARAVLSGQPQADR